MACVVSTASLNGLIPALPGSEVREFPPASLDTQWQNSGETPQRATLEADQAGQLDLLRTRQGFNSNKLGSSSYSQFAALSRNSPQQGLFLEKNAGGTDVLSASALVGIDGWCAARSIARLGRL